MLAASELISRDLNENGHARQRGTLACQAQQENNN
jgi:hypothetical protein